MSADDWTSTSDPGGTTYAMVLCYGQVGPPYCDAGETLGRQGTTCDAESLNVDLGCLCY